MLCASLVETHDFGDGVLRDEHKDDNDKRPRREGGAIPAGLASSKSDQTRNTASLKGKPRVAAGYRDQLIAAGIIHPAPELSAPDPATEA